jgi:hypothetical protein
MKFAKRSSNKWNFTEKLHQKRGFEEIEAIIKTDLQTIDQNQATLEDGNHGKRKAIEHRKEDVNSLLTIKNWSSPKDLQTNEASLKNSTKRGVWRNRSYHENWSSNNGSKTSNY